MSVLPRLAGAQGRKDQEPNKALGKNLVQDNDVEGIREIAANLWNSDRRIQTDCLSVLEQVGLMAPELIEDYVSDFIQLVFSKDNRLVWAAMINLALVADKRPHEIFEQYDDLVRVIESGTVITKDNGIKTLARVASTDGECERAIFPFLMDQLRGCRPKSVPQYAESIRIAVTPDNEGEYVAILNERSNSLSPAQKKRVERILRSFDAA